jgi:hypothetical protein
MGPFVSASSTFSKKTNKIFFFFLNVDNSFFFSHSIVSLFIDIVTRILASASIVFRP